MLLKYDVVAAYQLPGASAPGRLYTHANRCKQFYGMEDGFCMHRKRGELKEWKASMPMAFYRFILYSISRKDGIHGGLPNAMGLLLLKLADHKNGLPNAMGLLLLKLADHKNGLPDAMGLLLAALCFGAGIFSRADFILKGDRRH